MERRKSAAILADAFSELRGWRRSPTRFTTDSLARRVNRCGPEQSYGGICLAGPSAVYFREPERPHRPAAIAAHLYYWPDIGPEIEVACDEARLRWEAVADFPGWVPGAQLVV